MFVTAEDQYNTLLTALQEGRRIGFNTQNNQFTAVTSELGARYKEQQNFHIKTDLKILTEKVANFISKSGLEPENIENLQNSFRNRALSLNTRRFVPFWKRAQKEAAVNQLLEFPVLIERAVLEAKITALENEKLIEEEPFVKETPKRENQIPFSPISFNYNNPNFNKPKNLSASNDFNTSNDFSDSNRLSFSSSNLVVFNDETSQNKTLEVTLPSLETINQQPIFENVPPPPPPPGLSKPLRFEDEPEEPNIDRIAYKKKDKKILEKEMAEINKYIKTMEESLDKIDKLVKREKKLKEQIKADTEYYYAPHRTEMEGFLKNFEPLVRAWNAKKGGKLPIGKGSMRLYTDEEYDKEIVHRSAKNHIQYVYNKKQKITLANKLSYQIVGAYSKIKKRAQQIGIVKEKIPLLLDADSNEVKDIPTAKTPLKIEWQELKENGTLTEKIKKNNLTLERIKQEKSGNFVFEDFESKLEDKKRTLASWRTALLNRQNSIQGKLLVKEKTLSPDEAIFEKMKEERPEWARTVMEWELVSTKIRENIEIAPEIALTFLAKGTFISD